MNNCAQLSNGSAIIKSSASDVLIVIIIFSSLLELSDDTDWVDVAASWNKEKVSLISTKFPFT